MQKIKGKQKKDDLLENSMALEIQTWPNQQGIKNDFNDRSLELELTLVRAPCQRPELLCNNLDIGAYL